MQLTSYASPAILGAAAMSPKMAPLCSQRAHPLEIWLCPHLGIGTVSLVSHFAVQMALEASG